VNSRITFSVNFVSSQRSLLCRKEIMTQSNYPSFDINTTLFYPQPEAGYLRITGDDRAAFLQRQSTNDVNKLAPGKSVLTVLTTPAARILDVLRMMIDEDGAIGAVTLPGYAGETARYLKSRIFFMDKVAVEDAGAEFFQVDLEGRKAHAVLSRLGLDLAPGVDEVTTGEVQGVPVRVIGQAGLAGTGFRLLAPTGSAGQIESTLRGAGAERLTPGQYEIFRIEAGLPAARAELSEEYTPLETGLERAVSDGKGCYTGQEVIARQVTYDKVTQRLAGLRLAEPVEVGERIWAEGRIVGRITSYADSPSFGPIALGIIKRPFYEPGTSLETGSDLRKAPAKAVSLPFEAQEE
jgi:folate-binding protein YgfZ